MEIMKHNYILESYDGTFENVKDKGIWLETGYSSYFRNMILNQKPRVNPTYFFKTEHTAVPKLLPCIGKTISTFCENCAQLLNLNLLLNCWQWFSKLCGFHLKKSSVLPALIPLLQFNVGWRSMLARCSIPKEPPESLVKLITFDIKRTIES